MTERELIELERAVGALEGTENEYGLPAPAARAVRALRQLSTRARAGTASDRLTPWGTTEIAERYKVSKQTVFNWRARPDFPRPWKVLAQGPVWRAHEVREWRRAVTEARDAR